MATYSGSAVSRRVAPAWYVNRRQEVATSGGGLLSRKPLQVPGYFAGMLLFQMSR